MKKGVTLIEMVVAMALITALTGVVMSQFRTYNQKQTTGMAAERLQQVFKEAKTNALVGKKDCSALACGGLDGTCNEENDINLTGWWVRLNPGGINGYTIEGECGGITFMTRTETFPSNVVISSPWGSDTEVLFKPLNGGTDLGADMYIRATGDDGGIIEFSVTPGGELVPPQPTPTPTTPPPPTNTPVPPTATPTPYQCNTSDVKCVDDTAVCDPSTQYARLCLLHHKCVPADAVCTGDYSCEDVFHQSCKVTCVYPEVAGSGTCPGSLNCCYYYVGPPSTE